MELSKQAYEYSVRIAELVRFLREGGNSFPLSDELLSCGLNVGMALKTPGPESMKSAAAALEKAEYLITMAVKSGYLTDHESKHVLEGTRMLADRLSKRA